MERAAASLCGWLRSSAVPSLGAPGPFPLPSVSGPNGFAQDRAAEAPGLRFSCQHPVPTPLAGASRAGDACPPPCPLPRTHPPLNSLPIPRRALRPPQETHPSHPLCPALGTHRPPRELPPPLASGGLHSPGLPFAGLMPQAAPAGTVLPRPPPAGDVAKQEPAPRPVQVSPTPVAPDATGVSLSTAP